MSTTSTPDGLVRIIRPDGGVELVGSQLSDAQLAERFEADEVRHVSEIDWSTLWREAGLGDVDNL